MTLSEYIKNYREKNELSVRAFAALSGLSPQYVSNLERGTNNGGKPISPTIDTYTKVARATGIRELDLLKMLNDNVVVNPTYTPAEMELIQKYRSLDAVGKRAVEAVLDVEASRGTISAPVKETKIIPLFAAAAGAGEPVSQEGFDDFEVEADSKAQFAVKISGDSMEPEFHDGDIVLCRRKRPEIGEVAVIMVNGFLLVKQYITDGVNIYLRSLNRARKDLDVDVWATGNDTVIGYGTVMHKKLPLVRQ